MIIRLWVKLIIFSRKLSGDSIGKFVPQKNLFFFLKLKNLLDLIFLKYDDLNSIFVLID